MRTKSEFYGEIQKMDFILGLETILKFYPTIKVLIEIISRSVIFFLFF